MPRLAGKVAFITGAGNGIGRATAILFAGEGAKVVVAEIDPTAGEETAQLAGNETIAIRADVTDPDSLQAAIRATVDNSAVSTLHNNAGGSTARTIPRSTPRSMNSGGRSSSTSTAHFSGAGSASPN